MIALTGATGHLGNVILRLIVKSGEPTRLLVRNKETLAPLGVRPSEIVVGDVCDVDVLVKCFVGCREVIHAAALISIDDADESRMRSINVDGTVAVVDACRATGVRRLVAVGSIESYPLSRRRVVDGAEVPGTGSWADDEPLLAYGRSKADAAKIVLDSNSSVGRDGNLETIIVSPTSILGPYDYRPSRLGRFVRQLLKRRVPAYVDGGFDFVDVRDAAFACLQALRRGTAGAYYVVSGRYAKVGELIELIVSAAGVGKPRFCIPHPLALSYARGNVGISRILRRTPVITPAVVRLLANGVSASSDRAIGRSRISDIEPGRSRRPFATRCVGL